MAQSDPVLLDVRPAIEVVPGMTRTTILTSGPPLPWADYIGGQRDAIIGAVRFENLAETHDEAVAKLDAGDITVRRLFCFDECVRSREQSLWQ